MPIYEFYCSQCNVIYNFFSARIDTQTVPDCPKCDKKGLEKQISMFSTLKKGDDQDGDDPMAGLDETKMEQAFGNLMKEAENINEDDPRQMASLMRKFTSETGIHLGDSMDEAISRMEAGEDPEQVEKEMGDLLSDDDFSLEALKKKGAKLRSRPGKDETLYPLK
jgi:putative FmdB family regulatory protein